MMLTLVYPSRYRRSQVPVHGRGTQGRPARSRGNVAVVCLARDGDDIFTSDPGDLRDLALAAGIHVELIPV